MVFIYIFIQWLSRVTSFNKTFTKVVEASVVPSLDTGKLDGIRRLGIQGLWLTVHLTHWGMYIGNLLAVGYLCMYEQWYIALPLVTIISNPLIGGIHCAFNNLENAYREQLGWPLIEANFLPTVLNEIKELFNAYFSKG